MKKLVDYGRDDHPADDPERAQVSWSVAALDDCEACADLRVQLTVEDVAKAVIDLYKFPTTALASRIEMRPSQPPRKK